VQSAVDKVANGINPMEGIMELRAIAEKDSTNVEAQFYLGKFAVQSGQLDKALMRFKTVVSLEPQNPDGWWELASVSFDMGEYGEAISFFDRTMEIDSTFVNAVFFKGKCQELQGEIDQAIATYRSFLPLATDTVVVRGVEKLIIELETK
jgi:tetratricopeptide (TPR) repeat protein